MKKVFILAVLTLSATAAFADIPMPPTSQETVVKASITEEAAKALWASIGSPILPGDQLRTYTSAYKVLRAEDGLSQVVCRFTSGGLLGNGGNKPTYSCTTTRSLNKQILPEFKPARRMG